MARADALVTSPRMASINLTFHEDQDDEPLLVVPPALPFAAQMASST